MKDFTSRGVIFAWIHQGGIQGDRAKCGRCNRKIMYDLRNKDVNGGWQAIQKMPNGGYRERNCILVCYECLKKTTKPL
jgi:hypothetical protein